MPLSLTGGAVLAADTTFQKRVAIAFYFVAQEVYTENTSTANHEIRQRYAKSVIGQEFPEFQKLASVVATNSSIVQQLSGDMPVQSTITDGTIISIVRQSWNALAGV